MIAVPFALYDAFSETAFGGSQAGVVSDAAKLDDETKRRIAKEFGAPATAFVTASGEHSVSAQFRSTVMELPMCGHGTIALMTRIVELGVLSWNGSDRIDVELCLASAGAAVEITRRDDGRPLVMLDVRTPDFRTDAVDNARLARLLGLTPDEDLAAMRKIAPDFGGLVEICRDHGIETVAAFCTEVERPGSRLHVRDFCPAVGVAESAAAGTTNAALAGYLIRHDIVRPNGDGRVVVQAEQGHEIERPSSIRSVATMEGAAIARLQVGGVATKIADGRLHAPRASK
jgi:predicted PhzF superfamily epimerase YddE/YHI9